MAVYIAHSREFDYQKELYEPIRGDSNLSKKEVILPHEFSQTSDNTREFYKNLDVMIAEVSFPATGLGIELGWAFDSNVPIVCIYHQGAKISGSLNAVTKEFYEYNSTEQMLEITTQVAQRYQK